MKSNKSYVKRLRVTRTGKIVARKAGQNHFNAKENSRTKGAKRRAGSLSMTAADRARFLPGK
jgi:ribosomal protein L35